MIGVVYYSTSCTTNHTFSHVVGRYCRLVEVEIGVNINIIHTLFYQYELFCDSLSIQYRGLVLSILAHLAKHAFT